MPESAPSSLVGQRVGDYRITAKLGAGGMGVVYRAVDLKLDRPVALKFLLTETGATDREKERFLREAKAASALDHYNIGAIHGIEETADGQLFIVMAFYEGETLHTRIRRLGSLPLAQVVDFAIQIAQGLAAAHAKGIVHRDVKPGNVILTTQGIVKVVDFGLARMPSAAAITESATITGTARYMSPEQALGRVVDQRSDIWSLGVVVTEMATGKHVFEGDSVPATLFAIVNASPAMVDQAPPALRPIIYRALAKDPAQRYQTLAEMITDLKGLQISGDIPTSTMERKEFEARVEKASGSGLQPWTQVRPKGRVLRWVLGTLAAVVLLAGTAFLVPAVRQRLLTTLNPPKVDHIAVLPLDSVGKDSADEAVSDGLMEMLTSRLSNLENANRSLWVVPASEVRRRKVKDPVSARKEFGANLVIAGSVRRSGRGVELILNLVDAAAMRQLGSAVLSDPSGDYAALQDAAVARVAKLLRVEAAPAALSASGGGIAPVAYESYLKGVGYLRRYDKPGNLDSAVAAFEDARSSDPKSALALAGLAEAYWQRYVLDKNPQWIDQATEYCRRAAESNDQLAPVFVTLGRIHVGTGKAELGLQEFQRALKLDARNADAYLGEASAYENMGRLQDAEATFQRAAALRPDYWDGYNKLGLFYFRQRRYADALPPFRRAVELTPDNAAAWINLGAGYERLEKPAEAESAYRKSIALSPSYAAYANLGNIYANQRNYAAAIQAREKALELNDKDFRVWVNLGNAYRALHNDAKARAAYLRALPLNEQAAKIQSRNPDPQSGLALVYAKLGMRDQGLAAIRTALALAPDATITMLRAMETYEILGERKQALDWAARYLQKGGSADELRQNPDLRQLIADPKFKFPGH